MHLREIVPNESRVGSTHVSYELKCRKPCLLGCRVVQAGKWTPINLPADVAPLAQVYPPFLFTSAAFRFIEDSSTEVSLWHSAVQLELNPIMAGISEYKMTDMDVVEQGTRGEKPNSLTPELQTANRQQASGLEVYTSRENIFRSCS